ncbi:GNAT family N-acetyltransferase [Metabacillus malikii]|uniref:Ribosomal protein S18 acetylase RimI-like enzyme n=1 Tax=Metabacillus malikii TaxID=1504265 RepID=A0ABT9ZCZ1_9BACI|nr:GNAT family N-acetyltransferase [Metabacillus malikii]MDQ0230127.1 ribosomal protein S18 acetylase RimI-like enzyme [Metabacillus malikii]
MEITIKELNKHEITRIKEIDRSEEIGYKYVHNDGELEKVELNVHAPRWTPEIIQENINMLTPILDNEGHFLGAFHQEKLVGVAVLGGEFIGDNQDELQMAFLYTSNGYRRSGIGKQLMDKVSHLAKSKGAKKLYISAAETESAVSFYLHYGCKLAPKVNSELYALNPEDIHFIKEL